MKNTLLSFALAAALCASLAAEPIYVRNRPFKGPASGQGQAMMVGLKEMAAALELNVVEKNGGYLVETAEGEPKEGEVLVNGKPITAVAGETGIAVNLKELVEAAGLVYRPNKSMGTIDISKAPGGKPTGTASAGGGFPGKATVINASTPGAYVKLSDLPVKGMFTLILLYRDGEKDAGYKRCFSYVDGFLSNPEVVLYKVNVGRADSPMCTSMESPATPRMLVYDKRGIYKTIFPGHSILQSLDKLPPLFPQLQGAGAPPSYQLK